MDLGLNGRVAMVTGGSRGLGRQIASTLAREGCRISICARDQQRLEATVAELSGQGYHVSGTTTDVTKESDASRFYQETLAALGNPDILVNNVGGSLNGLLKDTTDQDFQNQLQLNLASTFYGMREALAVMLPAGRGSIVNIASAAGLMGSPGLGPYAAAKAAIINMTQTAAVENARSGVRINCVVPGAIATAGMLDWLEGEAGAREAWEQSLVPGRLGRPEEIANAVAFLAADEASYINGAILQVDGASAVKLPSLANPE